MPKQHPYVNSIGSSPETFIIAKETIAAELRQVARELGR